MTGRAGRGVSTVLDTALAVLLVTGAVAVLTGSPPLTTGESVPTDATHVAATLLPSTVTVERSVGGSTPIHGSLGALFVAATAPDATPWFREGVHRAGTTLLDSFVAPVNVSAFPSRGEPLAAGPTPPPRTTVDAAVVAVETPRGPTRLVVRTWSA